MSQIISDRLIRVSCDVEEYLNPKDLENRKLYLSSEINALDCEESCNQHLSRTGHIIKQIFDFNEQDKDLRPDERIPTRLFINLPGGDISEGFFLSVRHRALKNPDSHYQHRHLGVHGLFDWYYWAQAFCFVLYRIPIS